jgi:ribosomal protein S12 methylthiotransferase
LLVISQDTSAYGTDWKDREAEVSNSRSIHKALSTLGAWVRLHYVYPYPHVRELIPDDGGEVKRSAALPRHPVPARPSRHVLAHGAPRRRRTHARRDRAWRRDCPDITLRSTFIVGYPGETEAEFQTLLDWMDEAQLDRVGCFKYENVDGARSNALPDHVPEEVKEERWHRFMEKAQAISEAKLRPRSGSGCRCSSTRSTTRRHLPHLGRRAGDRRQSLHRRGVSIDEGFWGSGRARRPRPRQVESWRKRPNTISGGASAGA